MKHLGAKTIETERLILRRFELSDAEDMFNNWASSKIVTKFMTWQPYESSKDVEGYISTVIAGYADNSNYNWCIEWKENGQAIGSISVVRMRNDIAEACVGYCLSEKYWRRGIMTEAFTSVIKFLFEEVGVNRITASHNVDNPNSGKVMLKCGLRQEGVLRKAELDNTGIHDSAVYGIIREDYCLKAEKQGEENVNSK